MNKPALTPKAVFDHAHEIRSPAERMAYLDQACAGAPELRQQVEALLRALEEAGSFLEQPVCPQPDTGPYLGAENTPGPAPGVLPETVDDHPRTSPQQGAEGPGTVIGPYRLVEKLGQGGMGAVYLADQEKPIRRQVALKIIKPGMDSDQIVARFEAERQALTMMEHVNVARVFEAGATETGRPYFVMELVKGIPLTRFCDDNTLTLRERLQLFVTVCQAIQHAHQKGIIHRDIKPSNVLVAQQEGKHVPKVIDFGLAKATEQPLTDHSLLTLHGTVVGTLEYMSPEQADASSEGVDTRTDVYSLGVMLYELLTGTTPVDRTTLRGAGFLHALQKIREADPLKPSARLSGLGDKLSAVATKRKTEPTRLVKLLRGELDWIIMKALEKDRNRRYATASEFARDVQRYLDDEPVEACPPSLGYRLGKFTRKHRTLLATTGGFVVLLVLGIVGLSVGIVLVNEARVKADRARQQAELAETETRAALNVSEAVVQVGARNQRNLSSSEKSNLGQRLHEYERHLPEPGDTQEARATAADAQLRLGYCYAFIAQFDAAEACYRTALQRYQNLVNDFPQVAAYRNALARSIFNLAGILHQLEKRPEAEAAYRRAIDLHERLAREFPAEPVYRRDLAEAHNNLGTLLRDGEDFANAEKACRQAIALCETLAREFSDYRINLAASYHNLGNAVRDRGDAGTSLAWYDKAIALVNPLKPRPADAALVLRNACWDKANALGQLGRHAEAIENWKFAILIEESPERNSLQYFLQASETEEALQKLIKPQAELLYQAARIHARATMAADQTNELGLRKQYATRSLELLKQAQTAGWFRDPQRIKQLKEDTVFAALPDADFKRLLESLEAGPNAKDRPGQK